MPYTITERDNEFCVFLKDSDGNSTGDTLGCHPTHDEAQKQIAAIEASEQRSVFVVRAVNEPEGLIEGTLMLWGAPDARDWHQTWADPANPPNLGLEVLPRLMYEHGRDPAIQLDTIGKVTRVWTDDEGFKFQAKLDKAGKWFRRIVSEIKNGILKTSSATADHLMSVDSAGRFVDWLLSELSLTTDPSESRMPTVAIVRSKIENTTGVSQGAREAHEVERRADNVIDEQEQKDNTMSEPMDLGAALAALIEEFGAEAVQAALAELEGRSGEGETPVPPTIDEMRSLLAEKSKEAAAASLATRIAALETANTQRGIEQQAEQPPAEPLPSAAGSTLSFDSLDTWRTDRFTGRTAGELATGYMVLRALMPDAVRKVPGVKIVSDEYMRAMADAVLIESERNGGTEASNAAVRSMRGHAKRNVTRADVMGTDVTGYGTEWVATQYDTELWEKIRHEGIYDKLRARGLRERIMPRGFAGNVIPLEGADPTFYFIPQTSEITADGYPKIEVPASKVGTSNTTLTAEKLGAITWISRELATEDAIIDVAAQVQRQFVVAAQEQIEYLLINGDTETAANTNINKIDGTPAANVSYLAMNGFLKAPLITNTGNARDAGATFTEDDFRLLLKMMGTNGRAAADRSKLAFLMDFSTQDAAINIAAWKTADVVGPANATILNGELLKAWNVEVMVSDQMALANTAGKISVTVGNNTLGRVLLVRPDQWQVGIKREIDVQQTEHAPSDSVGIVAYLRLGMAYRAVDSAAAISYNVNVTG